MAKRARTSPGASSIDATTHAITLRGATYSWAILAGHKNIENRSARIAPGWYFLHTGARNNSAEAQASIRACVPGGVRVPAEASLPHGVIVGLIKISHSLPLEQCDGSAWATGPVCNVIEAVCELGTPINQKGALGQWPIGPDVAARACIALGQIRLLDNSALPPIPTSTIERKAPSTASKDTERKAALAATPSTDAIMECRAVEVARAAHCSMQTSQAKDALQTNVMTTSLVISNGARELALEHELNIAVIAAAHQGSSLSVDNVRELLPESRPAPADTRVVVTSKKRPQAKATRSAETTASRDPLFLHGCSVQLKWPTTSGTELLTGIVEYLPAASRQRWVGITRGSTKYRLFFEGREPKEGIATTWKRLRRRQYTVVYSKQSAQKAPSKQYMRWSEAEEAALLRRRKSGESIASISISLDRSRAACELRRKILTNPRVTPKAGGKYGVTPDMPIR